MPSIALSRKIMFLVVGFTLFICFVLGYTYDSSMRHILMQEAQVRLKTSSQLAAEDIQRTIAQLQFDVERFVSSPLIAQLLDSRALASVKLGKHIEDHLASKSYEHAYIIDSEGKVISSTGGGLRTGMLLNRDAYLGTQLFSAYHTAMKARHKRETFFYGFHTLYKLSGAPIAFISAPIYSVRGAKLGVFVLQVPKSVLESSRLQQSEISQGQRIFVFDSLVRPEMILDDDERAVFQTGCVERGLDGVTGYDIKAGLAVSYTSFSIQGSTFAIVSAQRVADIIAPVIQLRARIISLVCLFLAISVLCVYWIQKRMTYPLDQIVRSMRHVSLGQTHSPLSYLERSDEVGILARAVETMRENGLRGYGKE